MRSKAETYGLSTLTPAQLEKVKEDVTLLFRMMLLHSHRRALQGGMVRKDVFCIRTAPRPKRISFQSRCGATWIHEYLKNGRVQKLCCQVWAAHTNFEQGACGHIKPKPTLPL